MPIDTDNKLGIQIGVSAEFEILDFLYLGTTLSLYQKGFVNDFSFTKNKNTFNFLDLPIEIGYKMPIGNISVFGQVGPYVSVAVAGRSRTVFNSDDQEPWMEEENQSNSLYEDDYEYYKRFNTGLSIAAGVDYKQYQIRLNYAFGLSDFIADEYTQAHISSFSMTAAYFFGRSY